MLGNDRVEEVKNEETSKEKGVNLSAASSVVLLCTLSVELGVVRAASYSENGRCDLC